MKLSNRIFLRDNEDNGFIPSLNRLLEEKLPGMQALVLYKFAKEVNERFESYEKARLKIWENYGKKKKDKDGKEQLIIPKGKRLDAANKEWTELADAEEEYISLPKKISLSEKVNISVKDLAELEPILDIN
jgi:hypothetical protein